jgi:hypothetical protein
MRLWHLMLKEIPVILFSKEIKLIPFFAFAFEI